MPNLGWDPCENCRGDAIQAVCSRCRSLNQECGSAPIVRFCHSLENQDGMEFADDQPWVRLPRANLQFVDESSDLAYYYDDDDCWPIAIPDQRPSLPGSGSSVSSTLQSHSTRVEVSESSTGEQPSTTKGPGHCPTVQKAPGGTVQLSTFSAPRAPINDPHTRPQPPKLTQSLWSHRDVQEACLMRYFIDQLAQWFDSCDISKRFALLVPHQASRCPALLYAIYSASARHLSRSQSTCDETPSVSGKKLPDLREETALEYQNMCISELVNISGDSSDVLDENLLAAAVILRFYEEVDAPLVGFDHETYLRWTQLFIDAQAPSAIQQEGLQRSAFWVGFRQEFHKAFLQQRAFRLNLDFFIGSIYRSLCPADDSTWANRAVLHCADALIYSYGERTHAIEAYDILQQYSEEWRRSTPPTFDPIYYRNPVRIKGEVFPEIWYLDDCIDTVTATQHWHLAKILLTVFDPRIPQLGPGRKAAAAQQEAEVQWNLFSLCGIALSNRTRPALITACMGISMCGDRVTNHLEQKALLSVLKKTEMRDSLPTAHVQQDLKKAWGW